MQENLKVKHMCNQQTFDCSTSKPFQTCALQSLVLRFHLVQVQNLSHRLKSLSPKIHVLDIITFNNTVIGLH